MNLFPPILTRPLLGSYRSVSFTSAYNASALAASSICFTRKHHVDGRGALQHRPHNRLRAWDAVHRVGDVFCSRNQTRSFIQSFLPDSTPVNVSVRRTLSYPSDRLYSIIADIASYSSFLPYCQRSTVTRWSPSDSTGKQWPTEATLTVGFRDIREDFTSRVYCVPGSIVEAIGGYAETNNITGDKSHAGHDNGLFEKLKTRWEIKKIDVDKTDVYLSVEYKFKHPVYDVLSRAANDKVADIMIGAFEKRVTALLGTPKR